MLQNYQKAFKAYDIRGKYKEEIDEMLTYTMGIAIAKYLQATPNKTILIWSDVRIPNTSLITAFISGLQSQGIEHIYRTTINKHTDQEKYPYGICSTPGLYYLAQNDVDLAVAFTASHNPPEDVGMKFFDKTCTFLSQQTLLDMFNTTYDAARILPALPHHYDIEQFPLLETKKNHLFSFLQSRFSQVSWWVSLGIDFSTGAAVSLEKEMLEKVLPGKVTFINDMPDGMFSAHLSETQEHENYHQLIETIKEKKLDLGIMFDGDADRVGFVGPDGKVLGGDMILALVAEQLLLENKELDSSKKLILYEVMCSKIIPELVAQAGGLSKMVRMGRFFIKEKMEKNNALFAGETSGHFMFSSIGNYEMPLLVLYYVLKSLAYYGSYDHMMQRVAQYSKCPVTSIVVEDKQAVISRIKEFFAKEKQLEIDGISIYGSDFWCNVRTSNTENKIRYCVEADTLEKMQEIQSQLEKIIVS